MIHSYSAENFYSIGDKISVDFTVGEKTPKKSVYVESANDTRVSLIEAIIGPNASGKTNVLKALAFINWMVYRAFSDDPDRPIPIRPYGYQGKVKSKVGVKPSILSVTFSIEKRLFTYEFELIRERILKEVLSETSKTNARTTTKLLFSREWDENSNSYTIKDKVFGINTAKLRKNSTVVATAYRDNDPLATSIATYWRDCFMTNVNERGYSVHTGTTHAHMANHAIESFYDNPQLKERIEVLLSKYDIGFGSFVKHQNELQERATFGIEHSFGSSKFELPLEYESSGTKQMIIILEDILAALEVGGIAVIDELDANLHPEIVEELMSLFTSKELNPHSAQIIFSSHTPSILATLDKYQITLVEKNEKGQTQVWRLDTVQGVRVEDNYYTKYIANAYGAVPEIG